MTPDRAAFANALRLIARCVDEDPNFPVPRFPNLNVVADSEAEVDRAAEALGVTPTWNETRTHYEAATKFGPIEYSVTFITREHMGRYNAHMRQFEQGGDS